MWEVESIRGLEMLSCSEPHRAGITSAMCSSSVLSRSIERLVDLLFECLLGLLSTWLPVVWGVFGWQFGLFECNGLVSRPSLSSQLDMEFGSDTASSE